MTPADRLRLWAQDLTSPGEPNTEDSVACLAGATAIDLLQEAETASAGLRQKLTELHRRAQAAEAGVSITIDQCRREGVSLGRTLANAGYRMLEERVERAEALLSAQKDRENLHENTFAAGVEFGMAYQASEAGTGMAVWSDQKVQAAYTAYRADAVPACSCAEHNALAGRTVASCVQCGAAEQERQAECERAMVECAESWKTRCEAAEAEIARVYPHDGFWSVEVREGKIIAVIKLVQPREDVT